MSPDSARYQSQLRSRNSSWSRLIRTAPLILQMHGVRFDTPGHYSFELLVDNHHLRSLPLHVLADAKPNDVEVEAWHDAA